MKLLTGIDTTLESALQFWVFETLFFSLSERLDALGLAVLGPVVT